GSVQFSRSTTPPVYSIKISSYNVISHFQVQINLVQLNLQGYTPETDRVYCNIIQSLGNYSNSSIVGFELQTYCMVVWQPNHYTKIARLLVFYHSFLYFICLLY